MSHPPLKDGYIHPKNHGSGSRIWIKDPIRLVSSGIRVEVTGQTNRKHLFLRTHFRSFRLFEYTYSHKYKYMHLHLYRYMHIHASIYVFIQVPIYIFHVLVHS